MCAALSNWAGNHTYSTENILYPSSVEEVTALVQRHQKLRVLGTRHSFNGIADSDATLLSLARLTPFVRFDHDRRQVRISANMTYGELSLILHEARYALPNMASLPHISVIGACMTATHGSGIANQSLAASVAGLTFIVANGDFVKVSREADGEIFEGAVVSLGALGVVVELTLDLTPAFEISQHVYLDLPVASVDTHFDAIMSAAYSVSLFTRWRNDVVDQVWIKHRTADQLSFDPHASFFGAQPAVTEMHPIAELSPDACTHQLGVPGPWHERLPHFRIDATPSAGNELQTEYFVARHQALEALHAVRGLRARIAPHLLISEIRTIAADRFWMSPFFDQDRVGIHFTWKQDWPAVRSLLPKIEAALEPFNARPHWGKLFTMQPSRLQSLYLNLPRFRELLARYDRHGKFRNAFVETYLYPQD
jgi:xylitol oxidase